MKTKANKSTSEEVETITAIEVAAVNTYSAKRVPISAEEVEAVKGMPRNIQCYLLRKRFSIGQIADALGIKASSVPTNAKAGEKALARIKGLASVVSAIPE